jgi:small neutral amino acid transporter SnatA (MarC family)
MKFFEFFCQHYLQFESFLLFQIFSSLETKISSESSKRTLTEAILFAMLILLLQKKPVRLHLFLQSDNYQPFQVD